MYICNLVVPCSELCATPVRL